MIGFHGMWPLSQPQSRGCWLMVPVLCHTHHMEDLPCHGANTLCNRTMLFWYVGCHLNPTLLVSEKISCRKIKTCGNYSVEFIWFPSYWSFKGSHPVLHILWTAMTQCQESVIYSNKIFFGNETQLPVGLIDFTLFRSWIIDFWAGSEQWKIWQCY